MKHSKGEERGKTSWENPPSKYSVSKNEEGNTVSK
jgi:hypothetical protein